MQGLIHYSSLLRLTSLALFVLLLTGCGVNNIPTYDEEVTASWSQVLNQYQRRAELVPNLIATVKGYAAHEKEVLTEVVEARAKVGQMQLPDNIHWVTDTPTLLAEDAGMGSTPLAIYT